MFGKRIAGRKYAHHLLVSHLPEPERVLVSAATAITRLNAGEHYDVVRLDPRAQEVALLRYPRFFDDPFPALSASWRVHLPTAAVSFRDYSRSLNPPILHRKELMLPADHSQVPQLASLTKLAESIGLFDDPVRIGFRQQWLDLVDSKGYEIVDHELVPRGNAQGSAEVQDFAAHVQSSSQVQRHLTALSRKFLSAPVQALLRHRVLREGRTFFDYGCGKGDDLRGLTSLGYDASGWDPHFQNDSERVPAAVVNLGFVINVIESLEERIEALQGAYALTQGALSVAAMLWSSANARGRPLSDGYLTSRGTFQRYYTQAQLQSFIENVLDEQAFAVGPGVFFVFRDRFMEQAFLVGKQTDGMRAPRLLAERAVSIRAILVRVPKPPRTPRPPEDPARHAMVERVWKLALELGRWPEAEECAEAEGATALFTSWPRLLRAAMQMGEGALLEASATTRADEMRAFFAVQAFSRRRGFRELEPRLRRDVKAFFGSLSVAEAEGRRLLQQCAEVSQIHAACIRAAARGLGYLKADHSLQLHSSLIPQLDEILKVYIACATQLYGDVRSADLVKIHIQSGKVTLMRFDDFVGSPLPRLIERVKVKLRDQDMDVFEYNDQFTPPLLYFKSRYINEEFPGFPEQTAFDEQIEQLKIIASEEHPPTEAEFLQHLRQMRREIRGMSLVPATDIPALDGPCGRMLRFRELIECGDTWNRTRIDNMPRQPETYNALCELAMEVLDPVIEYFGAIKLTYGFASSALTRQIARAIAPKLDQHASCEHGRGGYPICARGGAAVDFLVEYEDMREVARWIAENCSFDRMYLYGSDRPIHVSVGPQCAGEVYELQVRGTRRIPRRVNLSSDG